MIGLSLFLAAAIVVFMILWLGKSNFFMKGIQLNLLVENANGITPGDEVFYRGLKVGNITDASVTSNAVLLKLKIEDADKMPIDSKFEIGNFSLISGTAVEITPGISRRYLQPNDTVRGDAAYSLDQAISGLQTLELQVKDVLANVDVLTGNNIRHKIDSVLINMNTMVMDLNGQVNGNLKQTLTNVNEITLDNKDSIASLFKSLSDNSKQLSAFLKISSRSAEHLDSVLSSVNNGKGSIGNLVKSDTLYFSLSKTVASIDSLVTDIKKNPKKYLSVSIF